MTSEGVFVFAQDGVAFFDCWENAAMEMEEVRYPLNAYQGFFTLHGERLRARQLEDHRIVFDHSGETVRDALVSMLRREQETRDSFMSDPEDPVAVANELWSRGWENRWPRWPKWLDRWMHGAQRPNVIG